MDGGYGFDSLSLRRVARAAGVVPTAFYRHFDEHGRARARAGGGVGGDAAVDAARGAGGPPEEGGSSLIARSVEILVAHVREHRRHFAFMAHARASGNAVLRHAIRSETKLFASELATDIARFPDPARLDHRRPADAGRAVRGHDDRHDRRDPGCVRARAPGTEALSPDAEARIAKQAEKQLRLIALAIPHWRSTR